LSSWTVCMVVLSSRCSAFRVPNRNGCGHWVDVQPGSKSTGHKRTFPAISKLTTALISGSVAEVEHREVLVANSRHVDPDLLRMPLRSFLAHTKGVSELNTVHLRRVLASKPEEVSRAFLDPMSAHWRDDGEGLDSE
jgi:hypothetical protein